jgi:formylglycine-generating enzyme required for sulfatase activity
MRKAIVLLSLAVACEPRDEPRAKGEAPSASASPSPIETGAMPASAAASSQVAPAVASPAGMREIPEGLFLMGSPRGQGNPEERPMHERIVARFFLDETEVTWGA